MGARREMVEGGLLDLVLKDYDKDVLFI